uniref:NADH dehydrogenase subunit 4L n=1 Tax=Goeldia sp. DPP-2018 TaxID=2136113 RepID=A0A2U8XDU4_9ARAC|nr:NADH dehydrogenase subunit 4L [Goeldia sp. DPP-2018]
MKIMKTMIIMSMTSLCWWRKNIIMLLLSIELLILSLFCLISFSFMMNPSIQLLSMLVIMATGTSLGLSLLVSMSFSHNSLSSNFINSLTFDKNNYSINLTNPNYKQQNTF